MKVRTLFFLCLILGFVAVLHGQTPLENPVPSMPAMPPPPEPKDPSPVGLLILAVILAHVCLPLSVIIALLIAILLVRMFKSGLTKFFMGVMAAGGMKSIKGLLSFIGGLIVLPAGMLGFHWATRIMDHPASGATWWIYALLVSVLTGMVFFTLAKAVGRIAKKQLAAKFGGGMMGGLGGMGGFGNMPGGGPRMKQAGKPRRR